MPPDREERQRELVLDAAMEQVMAVGVRRTTGSDIAKRAGISRPTLYKHFADVDTLVRALMTREFTAAIAQAQEETAGGGTHRERIVGAAIRVAQLIGEHPLFVRIVDVDPELLLPYLVKRPGAFQQLAMEAIARSLEVGMGEGSVRRDDPRRLALVIQLALRGVVFASQDDAVARERERIFDDLREMLDAFLAPRSPGTAA